MKFFVLSLVLASGFTATLRRQYASLENLKSRSTLTASSVAPKLRFPTKYSSRLSSFF